MNHYRQIVSDRNKRTFLLDDSMPSSSARLFGAGLATALDFFTFVSSVTGSDEIRIERRGADDSPSVTARVGLRGGITVHTAAVCWTSKKIKVCYKPAAQFIKIRISVRVVAADSTGVSKHVVIYDISNFRYNISWFNPAK
jgi:hypothetical protein